MAKKLNLVLLIDDDVPTNFLHKKLLENVGYAENIVVMESGAEALAYLTESVAGKYPQPDLILLDINMPSMTGWEFLEKHNKLDFAQRTERVIIMLTTSLNPDDKLKSSNIDEIKGFLNKPLDISYLNKIIETNFVLK